MRTSPKSFFGPGSMSMYAHVGRPTSGTIEVQGWSSSAAWLARNASVAGRSTTTYHSVSSAAAESLCQRATQSGAFFGRALFQNPWCSTPSGNRCWLTGRSTRYGNRCGATSAW